MLNKSQSGLVFLPFQRRKYDFIMLANIREVIVHQGPRGIKEFKMSRARVRDGIAGIGKIA